MSNNNLPDVVPAYGELEAMLDDLPVLDVEELAERTIAKTLAATSLDEILENPEAIGLRKFAGYIVIIHGIAGCMPSNYDTGPGRYMVLDITDELTGEVLAVTCGSAYVMARVFALLKTGQLPARVRVIELESKNKKGQTSLWVTKP